MVVQDQARNKPFSGCFGQNSQSRKIGIRDGCCRFYLDTDNPPSPVFDNDIDFVLLLVTKMRKLKSGLCGAGEFKDLPKNESLQQRPELPPIVPESIEREVTKRCEKTRIEEMYFRGLGQAFQFVGKPGLNCSGEEKALEYTDVFLRCDVVHPDAAPIPE